MPTSEEAEMKINKIQKAISNRYKQLIEECPDVANYLCDEMEKVLVSHGLLMKRDLKET